VEHDGGGRGRPPMSDQERRRLRLAVSRAAVHLFREHGVAGTSGERIAAAVSMSSRTLWRYFRSKEACVEPLLTQSVEAFTAALASWPRDRSLPDHLETDYRLPADASADDVQAVFDIVRMTRDDLALRAVWLVLHQRVEPAIADALAARSGRDAGDLEVRVQAATLNTALRVATEDLAGYVAAGDPGSLGTRRHLLATAVRVATRGLEPARRVEVPQES
jgi:AcrR family transcriptional regulator